MGLAEVQAALARLYTDPAAREMLEHDPEALQQECGLSDEELDHLTHLSAAELEFFANSLRSKRRGEVAKLLPRTTAALAGHYKITFNRYSATFVPSGEKKHLEDAIRFAQYLLLADIPNKPWIRATAKYELAWLEIAHGRRRFIVRRLDYDVDHPHEMGGHPDPASETAVWIHIPFIGVRHWVFGRKPET